MLRPNWSPKSCSKNSAVQDRGTGCPMSDPAMREALAWAIDKNEINSRLLGGTVEIANTLASPQVWFYKEEPASSYDPEKAKSILDAAGWTVGSDGVRAKDGLRAKIELCTTTRQVRQDTLALIAAWLKDIGVESVVNPVSPADIFATYNEASDETPCALSRSNFDLAEHAFTSSIDPLGNYGIYHSSQVSPKGGNNANVVDPDVDKTMEAVKNSVDFTVVKAAMGDFQDIYVGKTIEVPLYYRKQVDLAGPTVGNFLANPSQSGPTWNVQDWYVKS
jgi:peptide/nickel transport system substrate-binding protein